jgi:hypothetical protein
VRAVGASDGTLIFNARGGRLIALEPRAVVILAVDNERSSRE